MRYEKERSDTAYFMRRLYEKNLTTCSGGNISCKAGGNIVLITPSGTDKGRITAEEIGIMDLDGNNLTPEQKPSIESEMHLSIYRSRPDISAIVHAHPVTASSFTASVKKINCSLIAESGAVIGTPVFAEYAMMGTMELAETVSKACKSGDTILMANHGVLAAGRSLLEAFNRIEVLEAAAKITLITELLGEKRELSKVQLDKMENMHKEAPREPNHKTVDEDMIKLITRTILENL